LLREVDQLAARLRRQGGRVLALLADNGPNGVAADLAALKAGVTHLPLPGFSATPSCGMPCIARRLISC